MKIIRTAAVAAVALLALSGCAAAGSTGKFDWPSTGAPGGGGTLTIVTGEDVSSLEPGEAGTAGQAFPVMRNVLQGLLGRDSKTNDIEPLLATSWKATDSLHWEFTLRKGVTWHDGTPLNAKNAAASLTYIWNKEIPYAGNFVDAPVTFSARDSDTLEMTLTQPDNLIPAKMTIMPLSSPTQIKEAPDTLPTHPIGTGPYKFVSYTPGSEVKLELNKKYFDLHPGMFDTVDWIFRPESQVRAQLVQTGEADIAMDVTADQCTSSAVDGAKCQESASNGFRFLRPDMYNQTVLADPRIRQAIALGVDRKSITNAFISTTTPVLDNPGPKGMVGFSDDVKTYGFDVKAAKKLVAEAKADGINTDLPLTIKYRTGFFPNIDEIAQTVVTDLNAIGLNAKVQAMPDAEGLAEYRQNYQGNSIEKIPADRGWIFLAYTSNDLFDFAQPASTLLTCHGKFSVYCNEDLEAQYEKDNALTGQKRQDAFADLWTEYYEKEVPILPIAQFTNDTVVSGRTQITVRADGFLPLTQARGARDQDK